MICVRLHVNSHVLACSTINEIQVSGFIRTITNPDFSNASVHKTNKFEVYAVDFKINFHFIPGKSDFTGIEFPKAFSTLACRSRSLFCFFCLLSSTEM